MTFVHKFACAALLSAIAAPALAEDMEFLLVNRASEDLVEFYAAPAGDNVFDDNVLGPDLLQPGESAVITVADGQDTCLYDLNFVFANGDELTRRAVNLCEIDTYTLRD